MNKVIFAAAVALLLTACNQKQAANSDSSASTTENKNVKIALNQLASSTDPNCGMALQEGSVADTASYQGKVYGFCSAECKADFLKDPESHLNKK